MPESARACLICTWHRGRAQKTWSPQVGVFCPRALNLSCFLCTIYLGPPNSKVFGLRQGVPRGETDAYRPPSQGNRMSDDCYPHKEEMKRQSDTNVPGRRTPVFSRHPESSFLEQNLVILINDGEQDGKMTLFPLTWRRSQGLEGPLIFITASQGAPPASCGKQTPEEFASLAVLSVPGRFR